MPQMVAIGSRGKVVETLQRALNDTPPSSLAPLGVDGIFGPKTSGRVREFQRTSGLAADGIVGPMTWGALFVDVREVPSRSGCDCGNFDVSVKNLARTVEQEFRRVRGSGSGPSTSPTSLFASTAGPEFTSRFAAASTQTSSLFEKSPFRFLTDGQKTKARAVYGESLDFSSIFISDKTGLGNRPFTVAFRDGREVVQIMNCGRFNPSDRTLIHELAHVWQSQHHSDPFRFMANAVDCQAGAVVVNGAEVFSDPDVLLHHQHPEQFPFSAYAYMPGFGLSQYAAEQMANAVEHGDKKVIGHMKAVTRNAVDPDNVAALKLTQFSDRRLKGIVF